MGYESHCEHINGMVVFPNHVSISKSDYDALFKLKAHVTCMPSFIWSELLRLRDNEDSLCIHFLKASFKRKQKALEILRDSKHFELEIRDVIIHNKNKIEVKLTHITQDFKSIIPMI